MLTGSCAPPTPAPTNQTESPTAPPSSAPTVPSHPPTNDPTLEPTLPTESPTRYPTTTYIETGTEAAGIGGGIGGVCACCIVMCCIYGMMKNECGSGSDDGSSGKVTKTVRSQGQVMRYELPDGHMDKNVSDRYLCTEIA